MRILNRIGLLTATATLAVAGQAGTAQAEFGIAPGTFKAFATDDTGAISTQAGAHADVTTSFSFLTKLNPRGEVVPDKDVRDIQVDLPVGAIGDPTAVLRCSPADFAQLPAANCPAATQVGVVTLGVTAVEGQAPVPQVKPVFNLQPANGQVAQLGFQLERSFVLITARVRSDDDYGVTATIKDIPGGVLVFGSSLTLWGVPGDPAHDAQRFFPGTVVRGAPSTVAPEPFFTNPTFCGPPPVTKIRVRSWQNPDTWVSQQDTAPSPTGCSKLLFEPSLSLKPTLPAAKQPSGYEVGLRFAQNDSPRAVATSALRTAIVTLPPGVVTSPSSADGLQACSREQIALKSLAEPTCPAASQIGTVSITTPVLDEPLKGRVFLATPTADQLISLYLYAEAPGVKVKLAGKVNPDPVTGQLTTVFEDNPQVPVSKIDLSLKGGPRAPLSNPRTCGPVTTTTSLSPWSGLAPATPSDTFTISGDGKGSACDQDRFAPSFVAGTQNPVGGRYSPLSVTFGRDDADDYLSDFSMQLPPGLLAKLSSVTLCGESDAAAGTCGEASRVGSVTTAAGAGALPLQVPGRVYIGGPYKGAPFGLSIVVPAVAGPFDLGTVVVRAALFVDPIDAHVTVKADPLPTILKGIPLQIRLADARVDRPGFALNPTSCAAKEINGTLTSVAGRSAQLANRFQVGDCASLALKPSLALSLSGKGQTTDGKHPAVTANLTQKPGQANLKKVRVALPLSLALDTDNANGLCEFADGSKVTPTCPKNSIVGTATAVTPILNEPLTGPVYFVKNVRKDPKSGRDIRTLPKLVIPLVGQNGVKLTLTGTSDVEDDQLVTTFDNIPDAPVSSFKLSIIGGKGGILAVSGTDICKSTQIADQQINGQNNKSADTDVSIQTPSCPLKVISKKVTVKSVAVKVGGLGAGKVTVTGRGIKKTTKTIAKSTVVTITAKRTTGTPGKVTVSFDPAGLAKARKTSK